MNKENYFFNRMRIEERLRMIKNRFYGYDTPLSEYVCGKEGDLSDEKIEELADRLIWLMVNYGTGYEYGMSGAERRCLQLYIYLIIRTYDDRVRTFGDILEIAADMMRSHDSLEELIIHETGWRPVENEEKKEVEKDYYAEEGYESKEAKEFEEYYNHMKYRSFGRGFFGKLDRSYYMLTGLYIGEELTEEELRQIWDRRERMTKLREKDILARYEEQGILKDGTDYHVYTYEDYQEESEEERNQRDKKIMSLIMTDEKLEAARLKEKKWVDSFQDPGKFLEAYKEFRSLFFSIGLDYDGLEEAVILFLCREGRSGLADDEKFLRLYVQLEKTYRTARK